MNNKQMVFPAFLCATLLFTGCGGDKSSEKTAAEQVSAPQPAAAASAPAAMKTGMQKIGDMADAWNDLYNKNESAINDYEGMPIMGLVTPPMTFVTAVQFDLLNLDNRDGRVEGKLMFAGYQGFVDKKGGRIAFGYDHRLDKDGFGPMAKSGDRLVENGSLDLAAEYYRSETFTERAGQKISRGYHEFKRLGDGSMIALAFNGRAINMRGDKDLSDEVIFVHNGRERYDFVIAKAKTGPGFKIISFAEKGDLAKGQAIELIKAAGYEIESSGGIQGGKLVVDK